MGLGTAISNVCQGITSLLTTGSWQVQRVADDARTSDILLDRIPEQAHEDTVKNHNIARAGLTAYYTLEQHVKAAQDVLKRWQANQDNAVAALKACAPDDPKRVQLEQLAKAAIAQRQEAEKDLAEAQAELDEAKPNADAALKAARDAGIREDHIRTEVEQLHVKDAAAQAMAQLSEAASSAGSDQASAMLHEAREKIDRHVAQGKAAQAVADAQPQTAEQVQQSLDELTSSRNVDDEFNRLMGGSTGTSA